MGRSVRAAVGDMRDRSTGQRYDVGRRSSRRKPQDVVVRHRIASQHVVNHASTLAAPLSTDPGPSSTFRDLVFHTPVGACPRNRPRTGVLFYRAWSGLMHPSGAPCLASRCMPRAEAPSQAWRGWLETRVRPPRHASSASQGREGGCSGVVRGASDPACVRPRHGAHRAARQRRRRTWEVRAGFGSGRGRAVGVGLVGDGSPRRRWP